MGTTEWLLRLFVFGAFYSWTHFRICHIDKKAELTITALVCVTRLMKIVFNYLKYHLTSSLLCIWLLCGGAYLSVVRWAQPSGPWTHARLVSFRSVCLLHIFMVKYTEKLKLISTRRSSGFEYHPQKSELCSQAFAFRDNVFSVREILSPLASGFIFVFMFSDAFISLYFHFFHFDGLAAALVRRHFYHDFPSSVKINWI